MSRNSSCDVCPGCGEAIATRKEIPFLSRKAWRARVADALGYERQFIINLGEKTRIHSFHFHERDIVNGKPTGLPTINLRKINNWPTSKTLQQASQSNNNSTHLFDENVDVMEQDIEINENSKCNYLIAEVEQLKLLFRYCYKCGDGIDDTTTKMIAKGGNLYVKYWCRKCRRRLYWRSSKNPISSKITGACILSGNLIARLITFFSILQCAFPSKRTLFRSAQKIVRPAINIFYQNQKRQIFNQLLQQNRELHLSMDLQHNFLGQKAYHCTVNVIESTSNKIIAFATIAKNEVDKNDKSANAELNVFRRILNDLSKKFKISSVTTDNSTELNKLFCEEYSYINQYIDLWHILKNMFKKFAPKFKMIQYPLLKETFSRVSRFIWAVGNEENKDGIEMVEKCLSILFHIVGIHNWPDGNFVYIFNNLVKRYEFPPGEIHNIFMRKHLSCNHQLLELNYYIDSDSPVFDIILEDLCSDLRIKQLKQASTIINVSSLESYHSVCVTYKPNKCHFWFLDVRNMIAAIHHNYNIDAISFDKNIALNESSSSTVKNKHSSKQTHKTIVHKWQFDLLNCIENFKNIDENTEEEIQVTETSLDEFDDEVTDLNNHWIGFFNDHVYNINKKIF